jgi:hypothetical protein
MEGVNEVQEKRKKTRPPRGAARRWCLSAGRLLAVPSKRKDRVQPASALWFVCLHPSSVTSDEQSEGGLCLRTNAQDSASPKSH